MDDAVMLVENLTHAWRNLVAEVQKNKKIKFEIFNSTFSQTYSLLTKQSMENSFDRKCIALIAEAYLFANIKDEALDYRYIAAFVLTERMLAYSVFGNASAMTAPSTIYAVEARKDITLDFNDVDESISKLTKVFEAMYWKKAKV